MPSNMERTLSVLKSHGLKFWRVEHWNQFSRRRVDLFNIIDVVVLDGGILGLQVCGADVAAHKTKILCDESENAKAWIDSGARLEVWGWRKVKRKRGGKATDWKPRIADILLLNGNLIWEERTTK